MLSRVIGNTFCYNLDNKDMLREIMVKIGLDKKFTTFNFDINKVVSILALASRYLL